MTAASTVRAGPPTHDGTDRRLGTGNHATVEPKERLSQQEPVQVTIFDTATSSKNLGDEIIMDAVRRQLRFTLPRAFFVTVTTHDQIGAEGRRLVRDSAISVVGGTNLLSSNFLSYRQWKLSWLDFLWLKRCVLMGVGWWQYQTAPNVITALLLRRVLDGHSLHSVRDSYTQTQLRKADITNTLNTSCVTLWDLDDDRQARIPVTRGSSVVTTITDYKPAPNIDLHNIKTLLQAYNKVYLWPQGTGDYQYALQHLPRELEIIDPQLSAYDDLLTTERSLDYVGTRLHAGIRAMTRGRRSIILGVDNRAAEIARDTRLVVHPRDDVEGLIDRINGDFETRLAIPWLAIDQWRKSIAQRVS